MKYALIDLANTFFRSRHIASRNSTVDEKVGMALHLTLASTNQIVRKFGIDHVIFCLEGKSWRKSYYAPYKKNRVVDTMSQTEAEVEENTMFWTTYEAFTNYLKDRTNCSVLRDSKAEADDLIARFIHLHPDDEHFIISSDTDFLQLIAPNVQQYNGITNELITLGGYIKDNGKPVLDKEKNPKLLEDPQYILFRKCMRGDGTDNVFSAYPGVREKGSQKKAGLIEAYADRTKRGFDWNNMMLQRWSDHEGREHRVLDDYERNRVLIDLSAQPEEIKKIITETITTATSANKNISQVGIRLIKFCNLYDLKKISEQAQAYAEPLNARYTV